MICYNITVLNTTYVHMYYTYCKIVNNIGEKLQAARFRLLSQLQLILLFLIVTILSTVDALVCGTNYLIFLKLLQYFAQFTITYNYIRLIV